MRTRHERHHKHGKETAFYPVLFCLLRLALAVVVFASFLLFAPEKPSATSRLTTARADAISGKAGGEGSAEYNKKLGEHDAQRADEALKSGVSFIPTPVGQRKLMVGRKKTHPRRLPRSLRFRRPGRTTPC